MSLSLAKGTLNDVVGVVRTLLTHVDTAAALGGSTGLVASGPLQVPVPAVLQVRMVAPAAAAGPQTTQLIDVYHVPRHSCCYCVFFLSSACVQTMAKIARGVPSSAIIIPDASSFAGSAAVEDTCLPGAPPCRYVLLLLLLLLQQAVQ
jgi:hypothetical protein